MKRGLKPVSFRPLSPDEPRGRRILKRISSPHAPIKINRTKSMASGSCYANVRRTVAEHGGKPLCGYMLLIWPGMFAEAMHHAVWQRDSGAIEDITTPPYRGMERYDYLWFVPDGSVMDIDDVSKSSLFDVISRDKYVHDFARVSIERLDVYRELMTHPHDTLDSPSGKTKLMVEQTPEAKELCRRHDLLAGLQRGYWALFAEHR